MDGSQNGEDEERRALAALMDPALLERRLADARLRRETALAARRTVEPAAPPPRRNATPPAPSPTPVLGAAPPRPATRSRARTRRRTPLAVIFVAGSLAGAAVAGIGPSALGLLMAPPQPPAEIAVGPAPPGAPFTYAPLAILTADQSASLPARATTPAPLPEKPFATPLDGARIIVNAPSGADETVVAAAMDALDAARPGSLARAEARVTIGASNVRYFHAADRPAALETAARLGAALGTDPAIRDFTDFTPRPSEGAIEVWLQGDAPAYAARRARRPQTGPAEIVMDTVRRARGVLERAVDDLVGVPAR